MNYMDITRIVIKNMYCKVAFEKSLQHGQLDTIQSTYMHNCMSGVATRTPQNIAVVTGNMECRCMYPYNSSKYCKQIHISQIPIMSDKTCVGMSMHHDSIDLSSHGGDM